MMSLVVAPFTGDGFLSWRRTVKMGSSGAKLKLGFIGGSLTKPDLNDVSHQRWPRCECDYMVCCWIINSMFGSWALSVGILIPFGKMKRGPTYGDANANPYAASQMQHISAQRMQQNSAMSNFQDRSEFRAEEERKYNSAKAEGHWQWDRDAQKMSPHLYSDGQGENSSRSFCASQTPDVKLGPDQESRILSEKQDMELGYANNPASQTFESLKCKFRDDIEKLTKEHVDAEDAEISRHREKIIELSNQYQEQLSIVRARYATRREEIIHRESQARLQQYQLAGMNHYQNSAPPSDVTQSHSGYGAATGLVTGEPQRQYGSGHFDSYRNHPEPLGRGRMQGAEPRVPAPGRGRGYNTGPRYYG